MPKAKAYSYIRFSSLEQKNGDSERRQKELAERYAKEHDLILDDSRRMTDEGLSAYHGIHRLKGALGNFLKQVENGDIERGSYLLVENLDRLSRADVLEALEQFNSIIKAGITIVTLQDNMVYSKESISANFTQLLISVSIMARAHEESETKARRVREAWKNKRERAVTENHKLTARCPAWLELSADRKEYVPIKERVEAIRKIFKMKADGIGNGTITRLMNQQKNGWKPSNPKKSAPGWQESYVVKLLHKNRALIGEYQPKKTIQEGGKNKSVPAGEPIQNYYPAVIDKELFNRVQRIIQENLKRGNCNGGGRISKANNLFPHIAKCYLCGEPLQLVDKGQPPKGNRYYICNRARRGLGCKKTLTRYDILEPLLIRLCVSLDVKEILPGFEESQSELSNLRGRIQAIEGEKEQLNKQISNLTDAIAETEVKEIIKRYNKRVEEANEKLLALDSNLENLIQEKERLENLHLDTEKQIQSIQELFSVMQTLEGDERLVLRLRLRQEIKRLVKEIRIEPGTYNGIMEFNSGFKHAWEVDSENRLHRIFYTWKKDRNGEKAKKTFYIKKGATIESLSAFPEGIDILALAGVS